jgi:adenine/guanine phosphoribosyltransferase-like PRPP-binding protein
VLAEPFGTADVAKVAGIEARGFVLATAVAIDLGVGFVAVETGRDSRGAVGTLRLQRQVIAPGDGVLVVRQRTRSRDPRPLLRRE